MLKNIKQGQRETLFCAEYQCHASFSRTTPGAPRVDQKSLILFFQMDGKKRNKFFYTTKEIKNLDAELSKATVFTEGT